MNRFTLILVLFFFNFSYSQTDQFRLNKCQADILNSFFKFDKDKFDFNDKKVLFLTGSTGKTIVSKDVFFKNYGTIISLKEKIIPVSYIILSKEEKEYSNGIDILVLAYVKHFKEKDKKKILEKLSNFED